MLIQYKIGAGHPGPDLKAFEETLAFPEGFHNVKVPAFVGEGVLTALEINNDFHANFQFYRLNVPLQVIKKATEDPSDCVYIVFFQLDLPETAYIQENEVVYDHDGVNVFTQAIDVVLKFPPHSSRNVVCIRIGRSRLESILGEGHRAYLNNLLRQENSFFIHEPMSVEMRGLLHELRAQPPAALRQLFYHAGVMQLLYLLMAQLNKRTIEPNRHGDPVHIARIFQARALLVSDLSSPPTIASLARNVLMSESQLKQSFREIFGISIYQYFQLMRLEKARQLLAANNRTVKEVGYELGFTNIGHFSRLFERIYHEKPKKFQLRLPQDAV